MLPAGSGAVVTVNAALAPSTTPAGISPSMKDGAAPPHGPDEPSTRTQSVGEPETESRSPEPLTSTRRPAANPEPLTGRAPRSATKPTMSDSWAGLMEVSGAVDPDSGAATRTSRTRTG